MILGYCKFDHHLMHLKKNLNDLNNLKRSLNNLKKIEHLQAKFSIASKIMVPAISTTHHHKVKLLSGYGLSVSFKNNKFVRD